MRKKTPIAQLTAGDLSQGAAEWARAAAACPARLMPAARATGRMPGGDPGACCALR